MFFLKIDKNYEIRSSLLDKSEEEPLIRYATRQRRSWLPLGYWFESR
jgi:hypothetical protein